MSPPSAISKGTCSVTAQERTKEIDSQEPFSFESIVRRHSGLVLGVCQRMLTYADAEDAAQAVFVLFWRKAKKLKNPSQIAGWLHRTSQFVCRNAKRSSHLRFRHEQSAAAESPIMSAEDQAQWNEIRQILDEEVNRLPEKMRVAFVLFHFENRPMREVAELLGSSISTVGTWLQRSREKLATQLSRRGIVVGVGTIATVLSQNLVTEAASTVFVTTTIQTVAEVSSVGLTACSPLAASLVKAGAASGLSKVFLFVSSLAGIAIGLPLIVFWMVPELQTRQSPDFLRLQGEWQEVATEQDGGPINALPRVVFIEKLRINGRRFERSQTLPNGQMITPERGSFVLDSSQNPRSIDFKLWMGTVHGVYSIEEDTLTICVARSGGARPDGLSTSNSDDRILSRYKRVQ